MKFCFLNSLFTFWQNFVKKYSKMFVIKQYIFVFGFVVKLGKGLGKDETGISKPIKNELKFNKMGIGYQEKLSEETTNRWWEHVYNKAASNVTSKESKESPKRNEQDVAASFSRLTDEELFMACGGRTAHKAARHGLSLNGKLKRIECQEKEISGSADSPQNEVTKKRKKRRQEVTNSESNIDNSDELNLSYLKEVTAEKTAPIDVSDGKSLPESVTNEDVNLSRNKKNKKRLKKSRSREI